MCDPGPVGANVGAAGRRSNAGGNERREAKRRCSPVRRRTIARPYQIENDTADGLHYIPSDNRTLSGLAGSVAASMSRAGRGPKVLVRPWGGWFVPRDHSALPRSSIFLSASLPRCAERAPVRASQLATERRLREPFGPTPLRLRSVDRRSWPPYRSAPRERLDDPGHGT